MEPVTYRFKNTSSAFCKIHELKATPRKFPKDRARFKVVTTTAWSLGLLNARVDTVDAGKKNP